MKSWSSVFCKTTITAGLLLFAGTLQAVPISINVDCGGNTVGVIGADITSGKGIAGGFDTTGKSGSLAAAAKACGEDHFNWYQVVVTDNGKAKDAKGNALNALYVDPPPGGYLGQWEDNLPWYWNETLGPGQTKTELSTKTTANKLGFSDTPSSSGNITFKTWLVSLNADSSFHSWHEGFDWTYTAGTGVTDITELAAGTIPTDDQYKKLITGFDTRIERRKVPEPDSLSLFGIGLFGIGLLALMARGRKFGTVGNNRRSQ